MQLLLEENGSFAWKCNTTTVVEEEVCAQQTATLLNVPLIAQTTGLLSPFLGQFVDHYGPRRAAQGMTACIWTGLAFLTAASTSSSTANSTAAEHLDRLLFVAFCLLAIGTWLGGLLAVQTGLYFTHHTKSRVIGLLNALFDAGSIVYLFLWWIANAANVSLTVVAGGFLALSILVHVPALYFWSVAIPEEELLSPILPKEELAEQEEEKGELDESEVKPPKIEYEDTHIIMDDDRTNGQEEPNPDNDTDLDFLPVAQRTTRQQFTSGPYLQLCLFFGLHVATNMWNLTTMRDFLAYLGDDELDNKYLTIFALMMPVSILGLPFVDTVVLRFGFTGGLQGVNVLALSYSAIKVLSTNLNVQIVGFILFSFYRCFLFSVTFGFLPILLAESVVGKAAGIMYAIAAVASFLNIPLANLAVQQFDGNFLVPNLVMMILILPCFVAAWGLGRYMKREKRLVQRTDTSA